MTIEWQRIESPFALFVLVTVCLYVLRLVRRDDYEESIRWAQVAMSHGDYETAARRFESAAQYARKRLPNADPKALARALLLQAEALWALGKLQQPLAVVEEALLLDFKPLDAPLRLLGAKLCSNLGQHPRAEELLRPLLDAGIEAEPGDRARARMEMGRCLLATAKAEEAIPILRESVAGFDELSGDQDLRREKAEALGILAGVLDEVGQKQESATVAEQSLAAWRELEAARDGYGSKEFMEYQAGSMRQLCGDPAGALRHWTKAVPPSLRPLTNGNQVPAASKLTQLYLKSGRIIDAEREAARLVEYLARRERSNQLFGVLQIRARAVRIMGLYTEAEQLFQSAIGMSQQGDSPQYRSAAVLWTDIASMRTRRMEWDKSITALDQASQLISKLPQPDRALAAIVLNNRGVALRRMGSVAEAIECWQEAAAIWRDLTAKNDTAEMNLVSFRAKQGDLEAFGLLTSKVRETKNVDPHLPGWLCDVAVSLLVQGREAEAREACEQARALVFRQAGDVDVRPAETFQFWAEEFEGLHWQAMAAEMRSSAVEVRAKVAAAVDGAFPGRRPKMSQG